MTIFAKLFIILLILLMVFAAFVLFSGKEAAFATQNGPGLNRISAGVAWLEVCAIPEAGLMDTTYPTKLYIPL
jgi:hypothetical protein